MTQSEQRTRTSAALARLRDGDTWRAVAAAGGLLVLSLVVAAAYVVEPQSPRDFADGLALALDGEAFEPNLRTGERLYARAGRAREVGADSLAEHFLWRSVRAFSRASAAAPDPRRRLAVNDRLADAYLELGWAHLARGRGGWLGLGRDAAELEAAERVASCVVGLAPTQRRAQINAFVEALETVLDRPLAGRCPG